MFTRRYIKLLTSEIMNKFDLILIPISDKHRHYSLNHAFTLLNDLQEKVHNLKKIQTCLLFHESPTSYWTHQASCFMFHKYIKKMGTERYKILKKKPPICSFFIQDKVDAIANEIGVSFKELENESSENEYTKKYYELLDSYDLETQYYYVEKENDLQFNHLMNYISEIRKTK